MRDKKISKTPEASSEDTPFEAETEDTGREAYYRGGPVRSDEPERDWFIENGVQPQTDGSASEPGARRSPASGGKA
jgi:hypothetical protein